ncbi:hypothetical protein ACTPEM_23830, partial [Clostridioides difficile]
AISDGMGKGKKAYEESSATIDILEKMIDAKIKDEIVIDTINNQVLYYNTLYIFILYKFILEILQTMLYPKLF